MFMACTKNERIIQQIFNSILADNIHQNHVWEKIRNIPDEKLWSVHVDQKKKLIKLVKESTMERLRRCGYGYEEINEIISKLNPEALTIGFARRFATYKRATLIFKDLEKKELLKY